MSLEISTVAVNDTPCVRCTTTEFPVLLVFKKTSGSSKVTVTGGNTTRDDTAKKTSQGRASDMPKTGDFDMVRYLIVLILFLFGSINLLSTLPMERLRIRK